jgi:hypothetical protein
LTNLPANSRLDDALQWCHERELQLVSDVTHVYFIAASHAVKVGVSNNVDKRMRMMQVGNVEPMELLDAFGFDTRGEAMGFERLCHGQLGLAHIRGEWFKRPAVEAFLRTGRSAGARRLALVEDLLGGQELEDGTDLRWATR